MTMPNKSLATRDGVSSSASRFTLLVLLLAGLFGSRYLAERATKLLSSEEKLALLDFRLGMVRHAHSMVGLLLVISQVWIDSNVRASDELTTTSNNSSKLRRAKIDSERETVTRLVGAEAREAGRAVLGVQRVSNPTGPPTWAVLTCKPQSAAEKEMEGTQYPKPELRIYSMRAGAYTFIAQSGPLKEPRFGYSPPSAVKLECMDLNNDGLDEVVVTEEWRGASWEPGCALVFELAPDRLLEVGTLTSDCPVEVQRLAGYKQLVIRISFGIGDLSHGDQPEWTDYYTYDGKRIVLVNDLLREEFRMLRKDIKNVLRKHSDDAELLYYLGVADKILGETKEANRASIMAKSLGYRERNSKEHEGLFVDQKPTVPR
jgi:hypothetical protein